MSITPVPISIRFVLAPIAARSGKGEDNWRAKWCTRKYAPSAPTSSAATARSMDWSIASEAERVWDCGDGVQCPNDRNPIFFMLNATSTKHPMIRWVSNKAYRRPVKPVITRDDVVAARRRISGYVRHTPLLETRGRNGATLAEVRVSAAHGVFKTRGAL